MGILMTANILYANHVVNIDYHLHTACEPRSVYEQVGIAQRRSYDMNIGGSLSILDADDRVFPCRMIAKSEICCTLSFTGCGNIEKIIIFRKEIRL